MTCRLQAFALHCFSNSTSRQRACDSVNLFEAQIESVRTQSKILLLVFCVLVVLSAGCGSESSETQSNETSTSASEPQSHLSIHELNVEDESLRNFLESLIRNASSAEANNEAVGRLAMAYDANGFLAGAEIMYRRALSLDPSNFKWHYLLSIRLHKNGQLNAAIESAERALAIDGTYPALHLRLGNWLLDRGDDEAALAAFSRADALGAGPAARIGAVHAHLKFGSPQKAFEIATSVVEATKHPVAYRVLGYAWRGVGEEAKARESLAYATTAKSMWFADPIWDEVLALVKGKDKRLHDVGLMLSNGLVVEALTELEALAAKYTGDFNVQYHFALTYFQSQQYEAARSHLMRTIELEPVHYPSHLLLASLYQRDDDNQAALKHLERVVQIYPKLQIAHQELGFVQLRLRDSSGALDSLKAAIELDSIEPNVHYFAGVILGKRDRCSEALPYFQTVLRLDPTHRNARAGAAACLRALDRADEATMLEQKAASVNSLTE